MTLLEQIALLKRMDALIRRKSTGPPYQLAEKLGVSRSSVFNYVKTLKELGAPVVYSHECRSYIYSEEYHLEL